MRANYCFGGMTVEWIRAESVTKTEYRDIFKKTKPKPTSVLRKPKNTENRKKRKTENSVFADDDIYYLNYIHFSPLKLRNEDLNVHYCI